MVIEPKCHIRKCKHYKGVEYLVDNDEESEVNVCSAFLDGIPDVIAYGDNLHLNVFDGDRGLQCERKVHA